MRKRALIAGVCGLLLILGFVVYRINCKSESHANVERIESVEELIQQLYESEGKAKPIYLSRMRGPAIFFSPAMQKLKDRGHAIQPRLLEVYWFNPNRNLG